MALCMKRRVSYRMALILTIMVLLCATSQVRADYNTSLIRTVGWLVDNSDIIAVAVQDQTRSDGVRVVRCLKGNANDLQFPLKTVPLEFGTRTIASYSRFPACLIYVRNGSEVLEVVPLARRVSSQAPRINAARYGVSEYGEVYLTAGSLMRAIEVRVEENANQGSRTPDKTPPKSLVLRAPWDFPLETSGDTYMLQVTNSTKFRDHYIEALKTGDALTRLIAISRLKAIGDEPSYDAIASATTAEECAPSFRPNQWHTDKNPTELLTVENVHSSAKLALSQRKKP